MFRKVTDKVSKTLNVDAAHFLGGGFWLLTAQTFTILTSLAVAAIFAHHLSEAEYGIYRYVISLSVLFSAFSLTGTGQAIMQAAARGYARFLVDSTKATLLFGLGMTGASFLFAIYYYFNDNVLLAFGCVMIGVLQPISQLFINVQSQMYGSSRFVSGSLLQISKSLIVSLSSLLALLLTQSVLILLLVFFVAQALSGSLSYINSYRKLRLQTYDSEQHKKNLSYAKHTSLRNWFVHVANQFDSVFVFQQLGAAELALYSIASLLPTHVRGSFKNVQTLLIPKYSKHDSHITLRKFLPKRSFQFFILLVTITLVFIGSVPYIYSWLFPSYPEAVLYSQILALSFPASVAIVPFGAMQALRMEKELYWLQLSTSFIQLITVVAGVLLFGFLGAVVARLISQYARTLITFLLLYTKT